MIKINIGDDLGGQRLDRLLSRILPNAGRPTIQRLIRKKTFKVGGRRISSADFFVEIGSVLEIYLSDAALENFGAAQSLTVAAARATATAEAATPSAMATATAPAAEIARISRDAKDQLDIIYEDSDILIINKPAGLLTHGVGGSRDEKPETSAQHLVQQYLAPVSGEYFTPSSVGRLDRGTEGLLIFAKNYQSIKKLNKDMRNGAIGRVYRCIVSGVLRQQGEIRGYIIKDEGSNKSVFERQDSHGGKFVSAHFKTLEVLANGRFSLVEAQLGTGRSHQIRAMLAGLGNPIAGDRKYNGPAVKGIAYQLLFCCRLEIEGKIYMAKSRLIEDFVRRNR